MNAPTSIDPGHALRDSCAITEIVNAWRGNCIDLFAKAEADIKATLLGIIASRKGGDCNFPVMPGKRNDELTKALKQLLSDYTHAKNAVNKMSDMRQLLEIRNMLCHGSFAVTWDDKGRWCAYFRNIKSIENAPRHEIMILWEYETDALASRIKKTCHDLRSALGQLPKHLKATGDMPVVATEVLI